VKEGVRPSLSCSCIRPQPGARTARQSIVEQSFLVFDGRMNSAKNMRYERTSTGARMRISARAFQLYLTEMESHLDSAGLGGNF